MAAIAVRIAEERKRCAEKRTPQSKHAECFMRLGKARGLHEKARLAMEAAEASLQKAKEAAEAAKLLLHTRTDEVAAIQAEFDVSAHKVFGQYCSASEDRELQDLLNAALFRRLRTPSPSSLRSVLTAMILLGSDGGGPPPVPDDEAPDGRKPRTG